MSLIAAPPVRLTRIWSVVLAVSLLALGPRSEAADPAPNTISPPKGLDLGSTSFFDGLGREQQGWTLIEYDRFEDLNAVAGRNGAPSPDFKAARIVVGVALTQLIYTTAWRPLDGHFAISAALPVVDFMRSSFAPDSPVKLANNGVGIGDLVWGPIYQSRLYMKSGRPRFVWRAQLIISSPTGAVVRSKDINQGAGFWAVNPYVALSYFPSAKVELSNRLNYQFNFASSAFSNPPPIPGLIYRNGQAGQLLYDNFAASYAVGAGVNLGVAGYVLDQLTPNHTNGASVPFSRENELYLGPGGRVRIGDSDSLNLNLYLKVFANNAVSGPKLNLQLVHRF